MTGSDAYVVQYHDRRGEQHRLILEGPDARTRALRYARERGGAALVRNLTTGTLILRIEPKATR